MSFDKLSPKIQNLIKEKGFTGEQVTEVWNLSDGCGGEGDHVNHG